MTEMSRHTLAVGDRTAADPIMHDRAHRSEKKSKFGQTSAVVSGFGLALLPRSSSRIDSRSLPALAGWWPASNGLELTIATIARRRAVRTS